MFFAFCVPGKFWNLFLRSEQKLAKLPCRRILLSQTVEEAFEAVGLILPVGFDTGCGISGTGSTYLNESPLMPGSTGGTGSPCGIDWREAFGDSDWEEAVGMRKMRKH